MKRIVITTLEALSSGISGFVGDLVCRIPSGDRTRWFCLGSNLGSTRSLLDDFGVGASHEGLLPEEKEDVSVATLVGFLWHHLDQLTRIQITL
jgi:hypothetical protein